MGTCSNTCFCRARACFYMNIPVLDCFERTQDHCWQVLNHHKTRSFRSFNHTPILLQSSNLNKIHGRYFVIREHINSYNEVLKRFKYATQNCHCYLFVREFCIHVLEARGELADPRYVSHLASPIFRSKIGDNWLAGST